MRFRKFAGTTKTYFHYLWGKRLSLGFGKVLLRFFALFPALIANLTLCLFRCDPQLKQLMPSDSP